jgi:hypothetical protein
VCSILLHGCYLRPLSFPALVINCLLKEEDRPYWWA